MKKISTKIILAVSLLIIVAVSALGYISIYRTTNVVRHEAEESVISVSQAYSHYVANHIDQQKKLIKS